MLMTCCWNEECGHVMIFNYEKELYLLFYVKEITCPQCGKINVVGDELKQNIRSDWGIKHDK